MKQRIIEGPFYFTRHATGELKAKIPELHRAATFERAEIDTENRVVPVVFATEAPVDRWFGREKLVCTPDACNVSRANNLGAFLSEHDRTKQIGVIVNGSVTFGADRQARAKLRFSKNSDLAEQEWKDLVDGNRGLFSVGYSVKRLVLVEEDEQRGDLYEIRDWEVLEISLVSIPADANCTIDGRAETEDKHPVIIQAETTMLNRSRKTFARFMAPDTGANPASPTPKEGERAQPEVKTVTVIDEADRERCRELVGIGLRYGCTEQMEKFIGDGTSVAKAREYVMENDLRPLKAGQRGNGNPAPGQSPLLTGEGAPNQPLSRSLGQMIVESEGFREFAKGSGQRNRAFEIPNASIRATLTTSEIPSGAVSTDRLPGITELEQQRLTIADLMGQGTTTSSKIHYVLEESYTNAATTVAEGAQKPEATFEFTQAETSVRKIAVFAKISDEMLADYPFVQSYVNNRMGFMVREREEAQLLNGDGNAPNILGIMQTPNVQTQAMGGDTAVDALHKAMTKIRVTGKAEPTGIVIHPTDAQDILLSKDANGQYLAGGPFYAPYGQGPYAQAQRIWGLPMVQTTAITENTALVGAFRPHATVYRRQGITVEATNSNEDDFEKNLVTIRVEERLALVCDRPQAFCLVTGI